MIKPKVLIITGSVGVGKSSTADKIYELLQKRDVTRALIDIDHLSYVAPWSDEDPYNTKLAIKNLASIWPNLEQRGVEMIIIPYVIESAEQLSLIKSAIPQSYVKLVRLGTPIDQIHERLYKRHGDNDEENLNWHIKRSEVLAPQLEKSNLEDFSVDTDGKSLVEVAQETISVWLD